MENDGRGAEKRHLIETPKAHWWCEEIVWTAIREGTEKFGWG